MCNRFADYFLFKMKKKTFKFYNKFYKKKPNEKRNDIKWSKYIKFMIKTITHFRVRVDVTL